jgi:hypothetical protein
MTFTDAAAEVLRLVGRPLHYKEITDLAIEKNLLSHVGKSPEVTMGARLAATLKKEGESPLVRVKPGVFALREWDEKTLRREGGRGSKAAPEPAEVVEVEEEPVLDDEESVEPEGQDTEALVAELEEVLGASGSPGVPRPTPSVPRVDPTVLEDEMRAEAVAGAGEMFDEEDDDDQPILGGGDERPAAAGADGEGRRRRRRRRRGRGAAEGAPAGERGALPAYTATPVGEARASVPAPRAEGEGTYRPQVIDLAGADGPSLDDLAGKDLADAVVALLSTFDRNGGPVSLRQIAEAAQRRGRVAGDAQLVQSQVAAAVRADNARRLASGQRPRFRFAGGRVALTDWLLGGELARLEQDALAAVERYRDAARRVFARKLSELPGHAFVELCLLALERVGLTQLRPVRRPGAQGSELHFAGVFRSAGEEVRTAVVLRRDGRDVGRERVSELRGSLHHYGPATQGWVITSGQVLSGAREEAAVAGAAPVSLFDGLAVAKLCEENDVAVIRARMPMAIPDVDLLDALRAS